MVFAVLIGIFAWRMSLYRHVSWCVRERECASARVRAYTAVLHACESGIGKQIRVGERESKRNEEKAREREGERARERETHTEKQKE